MAKSLPIIQSTLIPESIDDKDYNFSIELIAKIIYRSLLRFECKGLPKPESIASDLPKVKLLKEVRL